MKGRFFLGIDQSTQGTKALLFDEKGRIAARADRPHRQIVDLRGWVEHDPQEILRNVILASKDAVAQADVTPENVVGIGISNQRETCVAWSRSSGLPIYNAIVWQCGRGGEICAETEIADSADMIKKRTGINLSPYFSAAKLSWIMKNVPEAAALAAKDELCCGTIDSWLVYKLTNGREFKTDYSNASRTQLFNISDLKWDEDICGLFEISPQALPEVCCSDSRFGCTDLDGALSKNIPIHCVMGDSHSSLFGQGCHEAGMTKVTYGTGSSIMMNIGGEPMMFKDVVTSLAWGLDGRVSYVAEGNINYTGAVITWLKDEVGLISSSKEVGGLAAQANQQDKTYLVPAFSGLGAPYWDSGARAIICGMSRTTGRKELVKAAEESIAYQVADVVFAIERESGIPITQLRADGGPTRDEFLMQFQSDVTDKEIATLQAEELSAIGCAYCAGIADGFFDKNEVFASMERTVYSPRMEPETRMQKYNGWKEAVRRALFTSDLQQKA